jgi:hypothetical protein
LSRAIARSLEVSPAATTLQPSHEEEGMVMAIERMLTEASQSAN